MKLILDFFIKSSADPKKVSLMVRGLGLAMAGILGSEVATTLGLMCDLGTYCYTVTPDFIDQVQHFFDILAQVVFYGLTAVGAAISIFGAIRKAYLTAAGKNKVIEQ
jgi:hypothetical protein